MVQESTTDRSIRVKMDERKRSTSDLVKVLVIIAIKLNASMFSVQDIHEHAAKYIKIPQCWCSKNYEFKFVECISLVLKTQLMTEL